MEIKLFLLMMIMIYSCVFINFCNCIETLQGREIFNLRNNNDFSVIYNQCKKLCRNVPPHSEKDSKQNKCFTICLASFPTKLNKVTDIDFNTTVIVIVSVSGGCGLLIILIIILVCCCVRSCPCYNCCEYYQTQAVVPQSSVRNTILLTATPFVKSPIPPSIISKSQYPLNMNTSPKVQDASVIHTVAALNSGKITPRAQNITTIPNTQIVPNLSSLPYNQNKNQTFDQNLESKQTERIEVSKLQKK